MAVLTETHIVPLHHESEPLPRAEVVPLSRIARLLLRAGRLMLEAGAEISRVEETMFRMGRACGVPSINVFATPTGIFLTLASGAEVLTHVISVDNRSINLGCIAAVNDVSRNLEQGISCFEEAAGALRGLPGSLRGYGYGWMLLARGLSCSCWALLMGGSWSDFLPAMLAGFGVHAVYDRLAKALPEFLAIFFGSLVGTLWAVLSVKAGFGEHVGSLVVGVIIPLVPGMALTAAVRDLIAGDLVAGVARGAEALLTAVAIAAGVWATLHALHMAVSL